MGPRAGGLVVPLRSRAEGPPKVDRDDVCDIAPEPDCGFAQRLAAFKPSRNRRADLLLRMAAAGKHPSGKDLPSMLPDRIGSARDHVGFARALRPHRTLVRAAVPQFGWDLAARAAKTPSEVVSHRVSALSALRNIALRLEPMRAAWRARVGDAHPSDRMNLRPIHFLCHHW